ncbi:NAD(P)/FAD-dependent oxidoreductase [Microbacterium sp. RD1]|uniref:NAD(P)/FAD-dependent oxidoreductase n=1 Tax=Microbacterium sp. RD1 TaxID=3457313 RepID=UPI003FA53A68
MSAVAHEADALVVGGGIVGVSVAARLARSARVVLVEAEERIATHSSSRSARQMQPSYGPAVIRRLTARSIEMLRALEAEAGRTILRERPLGWLATEGGLGTLAALSADHSALVAVTASDIADALPLVRPGLFAAAAIDAHAYEVDVPALLDHTLGDGVDAGLTVLPGHRVVEVSRDGEAWRVRTTGDAVSARVVVNAAGAWADEVAPLFGAAPRGLRSYLRTVVITDARLDEGLSGAPMVSNVDGTFYARPDGSALLISPSDETEVAAGDVRPDPAVVDAVIARAGGILAVPLGDVDRAWAGLRVFAPDHLPVVGWDDEVPDFYWLAGVGGYGIQTSPALSTDVAAEVRNRLGDGGRVLAGKKDGAHGR